MSDREIVISARGVGKKYLIGHNRVAVMDQTFTSSIASSARNLWHRTSDLLHGRPIVMGDEVEEFWALRDVDFDIQRGEAVGLIGRNGAGKSTLLKVLSRITDATTGRVEIRGKVASLLEVGTGFHPELSGRDNIFLNGGILGMSRDEIRSRFDDIVSFAGVENYIDTPVKRYSSGMYVRLAFAIAAHLEPEIMIIDEVLAVGDMEFQKRCLGKMDEVTSSGRTIIFVSHQMPMIASLCSRCLLMEGGQLVADGPTSKVIHRYQAGEGANAASVLFTDERTRPGDEHVSLLAAWIENSEGARSFDHSILNPIVVKVEYRINHKLKAAAQPNLHVLDNGGNYVFVTSPVDWREEEGVMPGDYVATVTIPGELLNDGMYSIGVAMNHFEIGLQTACFEQGALNFTIVDPIESGGTREASGWGGRVPGVIRPRLSWQLERS